MFWALQLLCGCCSCIFSGFNNIQPPLQDVSVSVSKIMVPDFSLLCTYFYHLLGSIGGRVDWGIKKRRRQQRWSSPSLHLRQLQPLCEEVLVSTDAILLNVWIFSVLPMAPEDSYLDFKSLSFAQLPSFRILTPIYSSNLRSPRFYSVSSQFTKLVILCLGFPTLCCHQQSASTAESMV